jgi:hypothetical protein
MAIRFVGLTFVCLIIILSSGSLNAASMFEDMWGVATDPLKLDSSSRELSETAQRIMIQLKDLEGVANSHVEARLEQVRSIIRDADADVQKSLGKIRDLEIQINSDANALIYNAQCITDVTLLNTTQKAFAGLISTLSKADPAIRIFGIKIIDLSTNDVQITEPDRAYFSTKTIAISNLEKNMKDGSQAYEILSVYQNLEKAVKFTRCYFRGQIAETTTWTREVNDLERLSTPWGTVVQPLLGFNR